MANNNLSVKEKEQLIVGTIISCNKEIKRLLNTIDIKELKEIISKNNTYHFNMKSLLKDINPLFESFDNIPDDMVYVKNERGNYYAYFQKVYDFLDGYEPTVQAILNESLDIDATGNIIQAKSNILTFKDDLKLIIKQLEDKNDITKLSKEVIKIKTLAKRPIFVYGYDICNNLELQQELFNKFQLKNSDLIAIAYNISDKQLYFIPKNLMGTVCYDLKSDIIDYYNKINTDKLTNITVIGSTYMNILKEQTQVNNIIEIYKNVSTLGLEFKDNLYFDGLRQSQKQNSSETVNSIIKK